MGGTSLRIDGTTVEETSTDLSIDMGRIVNESSDKVIHTSEETGRAFKENFDSEDSGLAGHISDDTDEVENLPEEPIVPVLKTEAPRKIKGVESRKSSSQSNNRDKINHNIDRAQEKASTQSEKYLEMENRKAQELKDEKERRASREKKEEKQRRKAQEAKEGREEEERRIAQEVREGRERYDRRSQDR